MSKEASLRKTKIETKAEWFFSHMHDGVFSQINRATFSSIENAMQSSQNTKFPNISLYWFYLFLPRINPPVSYLWCAWKYREFLILGKTSKKV